MIDKVVQAAVGVVGRANREKPADAVLREVLRKSGGITREDGRAISEAVFAYYRWHGWLDWKEPMGRQIRRAVEMNRIFRNDPSIVSGEEFRRAVPKWAAEWMEVSPEWLRALQAEPVLWLRARPGEGRGLAEKLRDCVAAGTGVLADALRYEGKEDLFRTAEFQAGEFELQDLSSQAVGLVCDPKPGETWWDACAGEGGKLLHLCDLMRNRGLVWASDRANWRLQQLKRRAARAKLFNYRAVLWSNPAKLPTKTKFDGVLVDAPCSGLGTWHRNPHGRWTTTPEDVQELAAVQRGLLERAAGALKPGGRLIYSVCTLTRSETTDVAESIDKGLPELKRVLFKNPLDEGVQAGREIWIWPQGTGGNGMFIAGWQRDG